MQENGNGEIVAGVAEKMSDYARDAVDFAREKFSLELDFSAVSIKLLEKIAAAIHDDWSRPGPGKRSLRKPTGSEIEGMCFMLGAYLGEAFRLNIGGEWRLETRSGMVGLRSREKWFFPEKHVRRRLLEGRSYDLWNLFQVYLVMGAFWKFISSPLPPGRG